MFKYQCFTTRVSGPTADHVQSSPLTINVVGLLGRPPTVGSDRWNTLGTTITSQPVEELLSKPGVFQEPTEGLRYEILGPSRREPSQQVVSLVLLHLNQSISTPGLRIPFGSTRRFAARSISAKRGGRCSS